MIRELRHIHGFLAVARCGSFTRAAAELRVSQPALTVQVRRDGQWVDVIIMEQLLA